MRNKFVLRMGLLLAPLVASVFSFAATAYLQDQNEGVSTRTIDMVTYIQRAGDNHGLPYFIVDKLTATLHVFDGKGRILASTPVLLGSALGDESVPGIGERKISEILPSERTTPAGRFVGEAGVNANGEDIIWVDYEAAVSMHRVRANNPHERRLQRLESPTVADNRISYGCINVPLVFYDKFVSLVFRRGSAVIYILPDSKPLTAVFNWDIGHRLKLQ